MFSLDKMLSKTLLPYNVTPPRPAGPTEAERKIEELTRQLEEEMERSEEQGEYFGIIKFTLSISLFKKSSYDFKVFVIHAVTK